MLPHEYTTFGTYPSRSRRVRGEQRLVEVTDHPARIVEIEQQRADRIGAERSDAVGDHQPARLGLERRPAVAELDQLPRAFGLLHQRCLTPLAHVVGVHHEVVDVVVAPERYVAAVDLAREQRHALVVRGAPGHRRHPERDEVGGLEQLRQDLVAVVRGVRGVVGDVSLTVALTVPSSSTKRTKRASSMPWLSVGPLGNSTRSRHVGRGRERGAVVRRCQPVQDVGGLAGDQVLEPERRRAGRSPPRARSS